MSLPASTALPGRLGDDARRPVTDDRLDPRLKALHLKVGSGGVVATPPCPLSSVTSSYEDKLAFCRGIETWYRAFLNAQDYGSDYETGVTTEKRTITGVDGNDIPLLIRRPATVTTDNNNNSQKLPCIVHIHGGGMAIMSAIEDKVWTVYACRIAQQGAMVISVDFRNSAGTPPAPFPAGLNDCVSAVQWIASNKSDLNFKSLVVTGESGGGNLAIATAMKLKDERIIDGVYASCPYISNLYGDAHRDSDKAKELVSLVENDDYMIEGNGTAIMSSIYDVDGGGYASNNPLAWPYHATIEWLQGLPPCVIHVNELDPLRDEGKAFYRKLVQAGVSAACVCLCGTEHGDEVYLPTVIPNLYDMAIRNLVGFAKSVMK